MLSDLAHYWPTLEGNLLVPLIILGASLFIGFVLNYLLRRYVNRHTDLAPDSPLAVLLHAVRGLPRLWCFAVGLYWTIHTVGLMEPVQRLLAYILFTILVFSITRVIARTLERLIALRTAAAGSAAATTSLLTNLVSITIYAAGTIIILGYYGISIAPLITALGVGGMAVALGLQESLANLFAGLHLILSRQVRVGDYILLDSGGEGRVTDITWRYTTILTATNNTVVVPNSKLASAILTNYDMPEPQIAVVIPVGVSYDSDLDKVEAVTIEVAGAVMEQLEGSAVKPPTIYFHTFSDSSIDFNAVLYARRFTDRTKLKHEFIKALTRRYREENIDIPFPIRTILRPDGSAPSPDVS